MQGKVIGHQTIQAIHHAIQLHVLLNDL